VLEPLLMKRHTIIFSVVLSVVIFTVFSSFAHAAPLKFDPDVSPDLKKEILADFSFVNSIKSSSATPLHQKIFGEVSGATYIAWFAKRVFAVGLDDCGNPNAVACVQPQFANKIWMTPNYTKFNHPQIARLSVVYHEARHTEADHDNWAHAECPTPFKNAQGQDMHSIWTGALLQGEPACDVTAFGSYGSATIFLKNIAKYCSNCGDKVRADADLYANDQLGRIIDPASRNAMIADFSGSGI